MYRFINRIFIVFFVFSGMAMALSPSMADDAAGLSDNNAHGYPACFCMPFLRSTTGLQTYRPTLYLSATHYEPLYPDGLDLHECRDYVKNEPGC
jgi:hypothetical protein